MSKLQLPKPHENQRRVLSEAQRFNVLACGRRWGKTQLGENVAIKTALAGAPVGWFAPTYKYVTEVWRDLTRALAPVIKSKSTVEQRLELITGGIIEVWSLTNEDAGRGRKYKCVVVDEAAMVSKLMHTWNAAIRPTLMDMTGDAYFLSTPKGRNAFWTFYQWGLDTERTDWMCWQMPTSANPYIPIDEIEASRLSLPERIFAQEVMADFIDDAGGVFRKVMAAVDHDVQTDKPIDGHQYVFGVDWGRHNDFTVITVIDTTTKSLVNLDRFTQIDYAIQTGRLKALAEKFRPVQIIAELNSMGEPLVEQLQADGLPMSGFQTTNSSKEEAIRALEGAFERGEIHIPNDRILISELQAYEQSKTPSGRYTFSAPEGMHDDTVMSLAMAWQGVANNYWYIF